MTQRTNTPRRSADAAVKMQVALGIAVTFFLGLSVGIYLASRLIGDWLNLN